VPLNGERLRVPLPEDAANMLGGLQAHKDTVLVFLHRHEEIPPMPSPVRVQCRGRKSAPAVLTHSAVGTDVHGFTSMTLLQPTAALAGKQLLAGHRSARELVSRRGQCGVLEAVSEAEKRDGHIETYPYLELLLESLRYAQGLQLGGMPKANRGKRWQPGLSEGPSQFGMPKDRQVGTTASK
jgi:hypothetical protein